MTEHQNVNSNEDFTAHFSFSKSTLPAKIIYLRKVSQENHVKRMKLAYKKKEMKGMVDISSCLSPSFPKKISGKSKTSNITPTSLQSCTGNIQSRQKMVDLLPARAKSDMNHIGHLQDSSTHTFKKKSTSSKINENRFSNNSNNKPSRNFVRGDECDLNNLKKDKSMTGSNDYPYNKITNQTKTVFCKKKTSPLSCNNRDESSKCDQLLLKKSEVIPKERSNITEEKNVKILTTKKKPSKIPILKSRLKIKDTSKENKFYGLEYSGKDADESFETMLNNVENQIKELSMQEATIHENDDIHMKQAFTLPIFDDDQYKKIYHSFCDEEESNNDLPILDKWMINILDTAENRKNPSECSLLSKLKDLTPTLSIGDKKCFSTFRKVGTPKPADINKDSVMSGKCDYITDLTESDDSSEPCLEIGKAVDEINEQRIQNRSMWNENFEADSTITLPSDKELEVADHRDPIYRNLPDYPNTPYNLRYPRYKFQRCNTTVSSIQIDTPENSNRVKALKNRRKCRSATPKRWKSGGMKRKSKKQILRNKET